MTIAFLKAVLLAELQLIQSMPTFQHGTPEEEEFQAHKRAIVHIKEAIVELESCETKSTVLS